MEVKISIFDILSYMMPGFLYLIIFIVVGDSFVDHNLILLLIKSSTPQVILIIFIAYMIGHALQPTYRINPIMLLFKKEKYDNIDTVLASINHHISEKTKKLGVSNRSILVNIIDMHNERLSNRARRFLAMSKFMRNLSFPFMLLSVVTIIRHDYLGVYGSLFMSGIFMTMSILSIYRSKRYRKWSYSSVVEGIIGISLSQNKLFTDKSEISIN